MKNFKGSFISFPFREFFSGILWSPSLETIRSLVRGSTLVRQTKVVDVIKLLLGEIQNNLISWKDRKGSCVASFDFLLAFAEMLFKDTLTVFSSFSPSRSFITLTREQFPIFVLFISLILLYFMKSNRIFSELRLWSTARYPGGRISKVFLIGWGLDLNSNRFSCRLKFQNRFKRLLLLVVRRHNF